MPIIRSKTILSTQKQFNRTRHCARPKISCPKNAVAMVTVGGQGKNDALPFDRLHADLKEFSAAVIGCALGYDFCHVGLCQLKDMRRVQLLRAGSRENFSQTPPSRGYPPMAR